MHTQHIIRITVFCAAAAVLGAARVSADVVETKNGARIVGTITKIDVPGALATTLTDINNEGQILGIFTDANYFGGSFIYQNGQFTPIVIPNAIDVTAMGLFKMV